MWSSPVESTGVHLKISPPVSNPPQETQSTGLQVDSVGEGKVLINRLSTQSTGLQWIIVYKLLDLVDVRRVELLLDFLSLLLLALFEIPVSEYICLRTL